MRRREFDGGVLRAVREVAGEEGRLRRGLQVHQRPLQGVVCSSCCRCLVVLVSFVVSHRGVCFRFEARFTGEVYPSGRANPRRLSTVVLLTLLSCRVFLTFQVRGLHKTCAFRPLRLQYPQTTVFVFFYALVWRRFFLSCFGQGCSGSGFGSGTYESQRRPCSSDRPSPVEHHTSARLTPSVPFRFEIERSRHSCKGHTCDENSWCSAGEGYRGYECTCRDGFKKNHHGDCVRDVKVAVNHCKNNTCPYHCRWVVLGSLGSLAYVYA